MECVDGMGIGAMSLAQYAMVDTKNFDEAEVEISKIFCTHRMTPVARGTFGFHAIHNTAQYDGFSVNYLSYGAEVQIEPDTLDHFFLLIVPIFGNTEIICRSECVPAGRDMASLLSPTLPSIGRWHEGAGNLIIQIDRAMMERHVAATIDRRADRVEFSPFVPLAGGIGDVIGAQARQMMQIAETVACKRTARFIQRKLCDALIGLLIAGVPNNYSNLIEGPSRGPAPVHVKRVEDFIRAHASQDMSIPELTQIAGVSLRTLQNGFRRFRGLTLTDAIREVRLEQWRALLQTAGKGARASDLALSAGLMHYGRAAESYRQRYGEKPSETLRRHG